jgi:trans-2,3-dihydro-3-hydroxyanthranilate isomerase
MKFGVEQGVEMGRRSVIGVEIEVVGGNVDRVELSGTAVQVMEGSLRI